MNKIYTLSLFLIILSFSFLSASGQTFKPGLHVGLNTSQVGGDGYSGFNKLGITFGGFVRYRLNEQWSTQFELSFVQKGSRNDFSISENDPNQASEIFLLRMNYVEIPLLINFTHRNFVYEFGLYYGTMVGFYFEYGNDAYRYNVYESLDDFNSDLEAGGWETVKDWDFGGMIGFGYKFSDNVLGHLRWSNSIIPIKGHDSGSVDLYPTSVNLGWTNTVILGTLRYTFGEGDQKVFVDPNKKE